MAFHVNGGQSGASFLLAMLCSYENVGNASVRFTSHDNGPEAAVRVLEMRWNQSSSQQCIHHVGRVGPGNHTLHVTALSSPRDPQRGSNQVKLFGIYSQRDGGVYQHRATTPTQQQIMKSATCGTTTKNLWVT